jgi:hypothetical protein
VLDHLDQRRLAGRQPHQPCLSQSKWKRPVVLAVELQKVERLQDGFVGRPRDAGKRSHSGQTFAQPIAELLIPARQGRSNKCAQVHGK